MVCALCSLDSAAHEVIEYCIDKDFTKDLSFTASSYDEYDEVYVGAQVISNRVSTSIMIKKHITYQLTNS